MSFKEIRFRKIVTVIARRPQNDYHIKSREIFYDMKINLFWLKPTNIC